ncbi:MAG TPA: ABC transporter ATP-binding protein [Longimicrobiales bacterium]|nr:ABC transporter ATP-binding protein [Longimicrobiales bacterium]
MASEAARTPAPRSSIGPGVELTELCKSYREGDRLHRVLEGASACVAPGERVAVLGPSGSGKSTLLNLISGIDLPDSGRVRIGDVDVTALSEVERTRFRRRHVGFVFQFFNLLPTLTVMENLLLPLELAGRVGEHERVRALRLLERVELLDRADAFPDRLSGGEQQRVALARALAHDPGLLLADEPTGNLDEEMAAEVGELLAELAWGQRRTLVVVTHSRELAARMDRVLRLSHGRIVEAQA